MTSLIYTLASSNEVKRAVRGAVFNDIIALSRERILSRMRSSKYKVSSQKRQKCFVGLLLRDALNSPWHRKAREQKLDMTERDLENHGRRIKGLLEAMEAYEASDPTLHEDLAKLVRKVAHFTQSTPLRDLLATLTDAEMHQCSRERLVNCLNKIARYRDIAKFLCREAEGIPMLRNATVRSLKLPAEAFARSTTGREAYDGTVASALDKLSSKDKFLWKHDLPPWLQTFLEATPDAAFASEINRTLRESKIHAEIQILAHYETVASTVVRPRVIASSKDACYLCHAFISLHGQYRVPKTHGKLYRGWRLPAARTLAPLQQHLNKFLEQQVRTTVARLRGTEGIPSKRPPNESTLFPLAVSASLLSSMRNLSIVSNHSRLDLTAAAPAVENPSQVSYRALGTRVSGALLLPSGHAAGVDGDPGPCTTDHGSHGDEDSQENNSVASNSTRKDGSVNNTNGPSALIERATESITRAPAPDASPPELYNHSSSHVDDKSAKTASSCRPRTEHRGDAATVVLQPSASAANDWWFRYQNVDVFVDESSAKFSHRRLGKSAAVEALLRGGENVLRDVRSLAVGTEIRIPKDTDGRAYFACGDEAFMIDTRHEEAM